MTDSHDDGDLNYRVGYGKPPKATRFKKGEPSANPNGRPPKDPRLAFTGSGKSGQMFVETIVAQKFLEAAKRPITMKIDGRTFRTEHIDAGARHAAQKAANGSIPALKLLAEWAHKAEKQRSAGTTEMFRAAVLYVEGLQRQLDEAKAAGLPLPNLPLYPDDFHIDLEKGELGVLAPLLEKDRQRLREQGPYLERLLDLAHAKLEKNPRDRTARRAILKFTIDVEWYQRELARRQAREAAGDTSPPAPASGRKPRSRPFFTAAERKNA